MAMMLSGWLFVLIFSAIGFEKLNWDFIPWDTLNIAAAFGFAFSVFTFLGTAASYPLFVANSLVIAIPGNAIVDVAVRHVIFDFLKILGSVLITISFVILTIPENKAMYISKRIVSFCLRLIYKINRKNTSANTELQIHNVVVSSSSNYFIVDSIYNNGSTEL